jgi:hypothetical protein
MVLNAGAPKRRLRTRFGSKKLSVREDWKTFVNCSAQQISIE